MRISSYLSLLLAMGACSNGNTSSTHDQGLPASDDMGRISDGGDGMPATCITPITPQSCAAPNLTALPICNLSLTGCTDSTNVTHFNSRAVYYEVNSPLWSDNAAKTRAFVLPAGGTIHVKNCGPNASPAQLAECVAPNGISNGAADTGRWVFPVGTVMIKNFMFDGKLVETRLLMRVDPATAAIIQNGTDWVGYTYAWNEAQTDAVVTDGSRTWVNFNTGKRTVTWHYPSFIDCIGCHNAAIGTIGPETAQLNRIVNNQNQVDTFVAMKIFDSTAPTKPYPAAQPEPYANAELGLTGPGSATVEQAARSYLSANCGFCHRPDVNNQGFDLRWSLSLFQTGICNLQQQNGIPGMTDQPLVDFAPGKHADSAMWIRMHTAPAANDPNGFVDVGRMPSASSFVVDPQATALVASWIDSVSACPTM